MFDELQIICPLCNHDHGEHNFIYEDLVSDFTLDFEEVYSSEFVPITFQCISCNYCFNIQDIYKSTLTKDGLLNILKSEEYKKILKNENYSNVIKRLFCISLIHEEQYNNCSAGEYYNYAAKRLDQENNSQLAAYARNMALNSFLISKVFNEKVSSDWDENYKLKFTIIELLRRTNKFSDAKLFLKRLETENFVIDKHLLQVLNFQKFLISINSNSIHYKSEALNKINLTCTKCTKASIQGYILRLQQIIENKPFRTFFMLVDKECKIGLEGVLDLDNFSINQSQFNSNDKINPKKVIVNWINLKKSTFNSVKQDIVPDAEPIENLDNDTNDNINDYDNRSYNYHNHYQNPWIDVFGEGEEADTAYWNTD